MEADRAGVPRLALRRSELAASIGVSERLVDELIAAGELPMCRIGRAVLFPVDGVRAWLAERSGAGRGVRDGG